MPWRGATLWASGRDALAALYRARGWRRLWVPSYFCQKVLAAWRAAGLELAAYPDSSQEPAADLEQLPARAGDGVLVVNYFGLRAPRAGSWPEAAEVVEDHSHDPLSDWAQRSRASWCLASLRKTLPAPAGGAVWSPAGLEPPAAGDTAPAGERAALTALAAMLLKSLYLAGHAVDKQAYRALAAESEAALGAVSPLPGWAAELIAAMPAGRWRRRRRANYDAAAGELAGVEGLRLLAPATAEGVPFSLVLVLDRPARAAALSAALIRRDIYPARLWELEETVVDGVPTAHRELARRTLSLHCDQRYDETHMRRVARTVAALTAALERS